MRLEVSVVVRAQQERVYAAYTDFESMPKWSKRVTAARITQREGSVVHLESEGVTAKGTPRRTLGTLTLVPPFKVESQSESRFTRSKRTVAFEKTPDGEGTRVTATLDVEVKGRWRFVLSPRAKKEGAESSAMQELTAFARFVEGASGTA